MYWSLDLNNPIASQSWSCVFASAVHYLWHSRNKEIFAFLTTAKDDIFNMFWLVFKSQKLYVACVDRSNLTRSHHVIHIAWNFSQEG